MRALVLTATLAAAVGGCATSHPGLGTYGHFCISGETSDIGGFRLTIGPGDRPALALISCEGGCMQFRDLNGEWTPEGLVFYAALPLWDGEGADLSQEVTFTARHADRGLMLSGRSARYNLEPTLLVRSPKPSDCPAGTGLSEPAYMGER